MSAGTGISFARPSAGRLLGDGVTMPAACRPENGIIRADGGAELLPQSGKGAVKSACSSSIWICEGQGRLRSKGISGLFIARSGRPWRPLRCASATRRASYTSPANRVAGRVENVYPDLVVVEMHAGGPDAELRRVSRIIVGNCVTVATQLVCQSRRHSTACFRQGWFSVAAVSQKANVAVLLVA